MGLRNVLRVSLVHTTTCTRRGTAHVNLQAPPFVARTDTHTSRTAAAMARTSTRDATVINMGTPDRESKQDTLFGPNIGVVNTTLPWAQPIAKPTAEDSLSPDIIKTWIAKSKLPSEPTTTLQALVNLKRPTLRLVPLATSPDDDPSHTDSHHHHGLEFEYDCDAPKCRIKVNVILPADHPLAENVDSRGFSSIPVYESVLDGGFGNILKLNEGVTLELGHFEQTSSNAQPSTSAQPAASDTRPAETTESSSSSNDRHRKRFSGFQFHKRAMTRSVSGPALPVVDADHTHPSENENGREKHANEDMKDGVRVIIRLSALDADGIDTAVANEQATYLHVVRLGAPPSDGEDDTRPWVVRVVKREAIIGPFVFQLHEIYGLSSRSTLHQARASSPTTDAHTYPPTTASAHEELSSECLLCLSAAREVILLPCRHLVACKECAINMVEFGAGGTIVHSDDATNNNATTNTSSGEAATASAGATTSVPASAPSVAPANPRRKRKAKGWFCPVCRQPYTSLLRISTIPPTKDISDDDNHTTDHEDGDGSDVEHERAPAVDPLSSSSETPVPLSTGGRVLSSLRTSLRRNVRNDETLPPDVERAVPA
ncbi:hypothetical protein EDC04DRAFT_497650 [Pisolithus marmoratus]|nr:hypothetical protein EDC04DRAFT_497650 [Pisolithus marmoratus]